MVDDLVVVLSSDEEGNRFSNLHEVQVAPTDSCGEPCHPDDAEDDARRVVVLWPGH